MTRKTGIYLRISSDPEGKRLGVTRQREDCEKKAQALGWTIAEVYEDNDVSASNGTRPAYQRLLADIEAERIGAVICWDLDRLHRRPIELETFITLADTHKIALASVGGDVDLSTDNGRMIARIKGAVARAEVERAAERQRRQKQQKAEKGEPPTGCRCFGYSQDGWEIIESEAKEIRKAADALLAGASVRSIVADLNVRKVKTTRGNAWGHTDVRRVLSNPRYVGLRTHKGEIIREGTWPPILDKETHYALLAVLNHPDRRKPGPPRKYLLSGLAHCAICDGRLFGGADKRTGPLYRCESRKHICCSAEEVEAHVESVVIEKLSRPDAVKVFSHPDEGDRVQGLRQEEISLRTRMDGLAEAYTEGDIDRRQLRAGTKRLESRLEEVSDALAQAMTTPAVSELVTAENVAQAWHGLDLDRKRAVIDVLMTIRLRSPGRGVRRFNEETVEITWKGGSVI